MSDPHLRTEPVVSSASVVADRYRITTPIGAGAHAIVYAAEDVLLQRQVAVKVFRTSATAARDLKVQEAEAHLIAGMNHYALTTLFDAGIDTTDVTHPRIYLVMEHIPGVDLRRQLKAHGPLTPAQLIHLGFDLAEGLQYVHEHGFLHRDIKPANVLLADREIDSRIRGKLADFGISSIIGTPDPAEYVSGTAAYLSPEQVDGQEPTAASDIYALGLVLIEALTGKLAYPGDENDSAFARLDHNPLIPDSIPTTLASILRGMTSLLPEDRPALTEVARAFQTALMQDLANAGRVTPDTFALDEEGRLAAVHGYHILDTPPDTAFDRITHLACRLLDVPVALISIVDAEREWFKSRRGIDVSEIDRDVAICASTITTGEPFTAEDVQTGSRFADNPLVQADPNLHGFASVPLRTQDGHSVGTICVFDRKPRLFTTQELDDLTQLADMAVRELDLRLASRRAVFNT